MSKGEYSKIWSVPRTLGILVLGESIGGGYRECLGYRGVKTFSPQVPKILSMSLFHLDGSFWNKDCRTLVVSETAEADKVDFRKPDPGSELSG